MNAEQATIMAFQLLTFVVSDEELVNGLQMETGLSLGDLRDRAQDPNLHAGLFDYILQNEPLLMRFAAAADCKPESIMRARMTLPGFDYDT